MLNFIKTCALSENEFINFGIPVWMYEFFYYFHEYKIKSQLILKLLSAILYISLKDIPCKIWKMLFILPKLLFLLWKYSSFGNFPLFSPMF